MKPRFFKSSAEFRRWLGSNHDQFVELWVGFYKKDSGKTGITYLEAVEEALCFGWIDGLVRGVDEVCYIQRFTPRKKTSTWSLINLGRVKELIKRGRMHPAGLKAHAGRDPKRTGIYSFENSARKLDPASTRKFRANKVAWDFFQAQAPWYQRTASWWIVSAKKPKTKVRRLEQLIEDSREQAAAEASDRDNEKAVKHAWQKPSHKQDGRVATFLRGGVKLSPPPTHNLALPLFG